MKQIIQLAGQNLNLHKSILHYSKLILALTVFSSLTLSDLWTSAPASASVVALVVDKDLHGDGYAVKDEFYYL